MATGGHWWGGSVGTKGDYHFGEEEPLMEGGPALLIGGEDLMEPDCDETIVGCGMPGENPWKDVAIGIDFGFEGPLAKIRGWWAKRQAARLAALAPKRRPAKATVQAQVLAEAPGDSGDTSLDLDTEAGPPIGAGGLVYGATSLSDRSFV